MIVLFRRRVFFSIYQTRWSKAILEYSPKSVSAREIFLGSMGFLIKSGELVLTRPCSTGTGTGTAMATAATMVVMGASGNLIFESAVCWKVYTQKGF